MMDFLHNIKDKVTSYLADRQDPEQPDEAVKPLGTSIADLCAAGMDHCSALGSLFMIEMAATLKRLKAKFICLVLGLLFVLLGYLFGCAGLVIYLANHIELLWAVLAVAGFHVFAGLIVLAYAVCRKTGPLAPETVNELKSDYQCLQIAIKESRNS